MKSALLVLFLVIKPESAEITFSYLSSVFRPCFYENITSFHEHGIYLTGEENQYSMKIPWNFVKGTTIIIRFSSEAFVELKTFYTSISKSQQNNTFIINVLGYPYHLNLNVKGPVNGVVPYLVSFKVDGVEHCTQPLEGALDDLVRDIRISRQVRSSLPVEDCGQRKVGVTELIVDGKSTKRGDWPWHVAIYRLKGATSSYICGGTLISKLYVLTAAHCATINNVAVVPDILSVVLGKYNFVGGDISSQERNVFSVIVHEEFGVPQNLDNDIAILKLMTEAVYNDYIQPACLWSSAIDYYPTTDAGDLGTVAGWGLSQRNDKSLSAQLQQATLPMVSEVTCIKSNPIFYGKILGNDRKFCAGWRNGTSPCNGDSGGGFMIFVPDDGSYEESDAAGAWYVRGIVSMTVPSPGTNVCDPEQYVVFTDLLRYEMWIRTRTRKNVTCGS